MPATTPLPPHRFVAALHEALLHASQPEIAPQMAAYMKDQFAFYGLKKPARQAVTQAFVAQHGWPDASQLQEVMRLIWEQEYREMHYFGLELLVKQLKTCTPDAIPFFEYLITHQSWWDTVDWLATRVMGEWLKRHPDTIPTLMHRWVNADNMWLNRVSIIFQLKYKQRTDTALLTRHIQQHLYHPDFFIRKAIGWALREYSKTDADFVVTFVESHPDLSPLSQREALKWLRDRDLL